MTCVCISILICNSLLSLLSLLPSKKLIQYSFRKKKKRVQDSRFIIWTGDQSELLEDQILSSHNLAINVKYGFLSCIEEACGKILGRNWPIEQLCDHKKEIPPQDEKHISHLLEKYPQQTFTFQKDESPPAQGLKITKGFQWKNLDLAPASLTPNSLPHEAQASHFQNLWGHTVKVCKG